jgi:hypothetical protein
MASGIFELTRKLNANEIAFDGRIVWTSESNGTRKNSSEVTAELQLMKPNKATTTGTWTGSFTVGARTVDVSEYKAVGADWVTIATITTTVYHRADGTGTCYLHAKIDGPSATSVRGSSVSGSETVNLDKIARFATILSGEDFTDEENPTITYSNPAGSAVSRLQACISLDGTRADVPYRDIPVNGNAYTFELTDDERNVLRNASPNSNTLSIKFYVRSTIDDQTDRSSVSATMRIVNANPTARITVEDTNRTTIGLTGNPSVLIALHSVAAVRMRADTKKGATLPPDGIKVTNGKTVLTSNESVDQYFSPVIFDDITYVVTDSRNNESRGSVNCTFIPYVNPSIVLAEAIPTATGEMVLQASGRVFRGDFGKAENEVSVHYRYKAGSGTYTSWRNFSKVEVQGDNFVATVSLSGLDYQTRYTFQAIVYDSLHPDGVKSKTHSFISRPVFDWSKDDFRFNVPVDMAGNRITNVASPNTSTDAVSLGFIHGLGLGAGGKSTTDLNAETTGGWYSFSSGCANAPFSFGVALVLKRFNDDVVQIAFDTYRAGKSAGEICVRRYTNNWQPWEYLNPPMRAATEYRTVERHDGKPVFVKLIDFGSLPNSDTKNVAHNIGSGASFISFSVFAKNATDTIVQQLPLMNTQGVPVAKAQIETNRVTIYTFGDLSAYSGWAVIKYTK